MRTESGRERKGEGGKLNISISLLHASIRALVWTPEHVYRIWHASLQEHACLPIDRLIKMDGCGESHLIPISLRARSPNKKNCDTRVVSQA